MRGNDFLFKKMAYNESNEIKVKKIRNIHSVTQLGINGLSRREMIVMSTLNTILMMKKENHENFKS